MPLQASQSNPRTAVLLDFQVRMRFILRLIKPVSAALMARGSAVLVLCQIFCDFAIFGFRNGQYDEIGTLAWWALLRVAGLKLIDYHPPSTPSK